MGKNSRKSVAYSSGKPIPWWRRASVASVVLTASAALLLGAWIYNARSPDAAALAGAPMAQVTPDVVQQVLRAGKPTIIEFGANSCASCRDMKPVLRALALDPRLVVADVDILKERDYISRYQIRLMPTQVFYNAQGEETGRHMGKISAEDILAKLGLAQADPAPGVAVPKAAL
ncbi:MAG: thioredoxin family protein [Gammaproteobacteria bacterium]|uniref:thioredoxin family protein n=1 Tax=Rhodoferax sp. TaxID=50421 RepID=UPI0017927C1A|nr:thioredoxin family protein [Rhodoferax sp.]MBU3900211.1 thioredoxin family protein [Gammaproteobacteria bacterium]MBA3058791.1 thioredoxin family protein [Rhodoferax sp.]MBU3999535.1 thioredoxin family protein [Gammaproteobacteria bacterium]MBU4082275.1 thioredoxin family protein [Gammaproteobacteria bacterium]MBU4113103.1 thioredoxin family protein [Gammaproteobacteria bacterium]